MQESAKKKGVISFAQNENLIRRAGMRVDFWTKSLDQVSAIVGTESTNIPNNSNHKKPARIRVDRRRQ
jgi:hypothetical protein